jgi:hypothetical protein
MSSPASDEAASHHPSQLLSGDEDWQAEKALLADLSELNTDIARYVLRQLDVDAGRARPISVADERALAKKVDQLGTALHARADRREALGELTATVEGKTAQPRAIEPSREPRMDNGP